MRLLPALAAALLATGAWAQSDITVEPLAPAPESDTQELPFTDPDDIILSTPDVSQPDAETGTSAVLRGLDKVSGETVDSEIPVGGTAQLFGLQVTLGECRYPVDNPTGDAFAFLTIADPNNGATAFQGWMIASSPALNALDHRRYDIWVLRCNNS